MSTPHQQLAQAVALHQAGRLGEAEALYRAVLHALPGDPHALHLLGVVAHQAGRHDEARALIEQALAMHGPNPVFLSNLAAVCLALGDLDRTVTLAREAVRLQPDLADAHNNLGVALRRLGRLEDAEAAFRAAVGAQPGHVDAITNLGAVLQRQGRLPEALAILQPIVRRVPGHAQARNDLGGTLLAADLPEKAAAELREAIRLRPDFVDAHTNLGLALRDLGRIDEAMNAFREALRLDPDHAAARNGLAYTLEIQGKLDEALAELREVRRRDPDNAMAIFNLSGMAVAGRYSFSGEELRRIRVLAGRTDLPTDDQCRLHYALARLLDQQGAADEAFTHCARANTLRRELLARRGLNYDPAEQQRFVDRLIATFTSAYFSRVASLGLESELPVFVVGMMRSGTTLAEQILASHPSVHGAGELNEVGRLVGTLAAWLGGPGTYPECMDRLDAATAAPIAAAYLEQLGRHGGGAMRVVDKMPFNFLNLGVIATLWPRARIIHCRRDPVDTCVSCFFQHFGQPHPFVLDLGHLGHYYRQYERLMAHWRRVLPVPLFELDYEAITAEPEPVVRRLLDFCGLPWEERCLRFHETQRPVRTASTLQVRRPVYRTSVGRWRRYAKHLGPLLAALRGGMGIVC